MQASAGPHNSLLDEAAVTGLGAACEEETAPANTALAELGSPLVAQLEQPTNADLPACPPGIINGPPSPSDADAMEAAQKRLRSQVEDEVQASAGPHNSLLDEAAVTGLGAACEEETAAANTPEALLDRAMKAFEVERLLHKRRMENYAKCKEGEKPKNRPDLEAMSNTGKKGQWINQRSRVGNVPGVPIGYRFFCRAAMKAAGVHGKHMSGIDFGRSSKPDGKKKDRPNLSVVDTTAFPHVPEGVEIAVAVMVSGHYEDDEDMLNSLWYTGAGGNDFQHSKLQTAHQKLHGPNKALCNNLKFSLPVRLFRRSEDK
eukprot:gene19967-23888_t